VESRIGDLPSSRVAIRACLLTCWAALICAGVWSVASKAAEPPVYDAIGYVWKAKAFWERAAAYQFFNPLNVMPTIRPPGTVLLSYPFGFDENVNGFFFRSVAVPYLIWTVAVWLAASPWLRGSDAAAALFVAAFGTLPMFFHYALRPFVPFVAYWGLVDGFLGSLAGLAAAGLVRDWNRRSSPSFVVALGAACLGVFVKPAGVPLLILWLGVWLGSLVVRAMRQTSWRAGLASELRMNRMRFAVGTAAAGLTLGLAFGTAYMSDEALAFGTSSFAVATELFRREWSLSESVSFASSTVGWVPLAAVLLFGIGRRSARVPYAGQARYSRWFAIAAWTAFTLGLFLAVPPMQVRYFFPFVLFWLILLMPRVAIEFDTVRRSRRVVGAMLTAHVVLMATVASGPVRPRALQRLAGVQTEPSSFARDTALARSFMAAMTGSPRPRVAYIFQGNHGLSMFESEILYRVLVKPGRRLSEAAVLTQLTPMNWETGPVVKLADLRKSDYLVVNPQVGTTWLRHEEALSSAEEQNVLQAYLLSLSTAQGIRRWDSTESVLVLEVVQRDALAANLDSFVRTRKWRKFFVDTNSSTFSDSSTSRSGT
jgi:hypothetical protein